MNSLENIKLNKAKSNLLINNISTADNYLDQYYDHKKNFRRSANPARKPTDLSLLHHDNSEIIIANNENNLKFSYYKRSKSDNKIFYIKTDEIYTKLLLDKSNKRIRRDYFGNIIKKNGVHKISFAVGDKLTSTRKVTSFSKITRKLSNETRRKEEGFCLLF